MKRKLSMIVILLFVMSACGTLSIDFRKLDTMEKKYQFAQEEWIDALRQYRDFMATQTSEEKLKYHEKFDIAIRNVDLALDLWGTLIGGPSETEIGINGFMEAKNKLLRLGFEKFYKGGDS